MSYLREYNGSDVRYADFAWIVQLRSIACSLAAIVVGYINASSKIKTKLFVIIGCILNVGSIALTHLTIKKSFGLVIGKQ